MKNCRREPARSIFELASQSREGGELSEGMNIHDSRDYNSSFNFRGAAVRKCTRVTREYTRRRRRRRRDTRARAATIRRA